MAAKFGIPLVFYGENEAEFGNPAAITRAAGRAFFATNAGDNIYLGGVSLRQLEEDFKGDPSDLAIYLPSDTCDIEKTTFRYTIWAIISNGTRPCVLLACGARRL